MKVAVSFIKSKYNEVETITKINETTADYLHVDIMDGKFTPNKNYVFSDIEKFLKNNKKPLDVHLMVNNPSKYIEDYVTFNTEYITFHLETVSKPVDVINKIHSYGIKCGISIKPNTSIDLLKPYLDKIEQVLIMSVEPGLGGQEFMTSVVPKINELNNLKGNYIISIDGGINSETIEYVKDCDMVVSGSYICMSDNYQKQINDLKIN